MPTLDWIGKSKVVNHHLDVPYCVLDRKYSFDENGQHEEDNGSENMIIHGDNLLALKISSHINFRFECSSSPIFIKITPSSASNFCNNLSRGYIMHSHLS